MDHSYLKESDVEVDIESGGATSEDESTKGHRSSNLQTKRTFSRVWSDLLSFGRASKGKCGVNSCSSSSSFGSVDGENTKFSVHKSSEVEESHGLMVLVEKNFADDKCKKTNSRKPSKPPRAPKGPLLDAADRKLVREITELAMIKRARIKRIKAMNKMKATKAATSSSSSGVSAMVITVLFCFVIFFQGICYRHGASVMLQGSPAPAVGSSEEGLISVQFYKSFPTIEKHDHDPTSFVEQQGSSLVLGEETRKVAR